MGESQTITRTNAAPVTGERKPRAWFAATAVALALGLVLSLGVSQSAAQQSRATVQGSCLAANGRIDVVIYNFENEINSYVVGVSGLSPRERIVNPGESTKVSFTGRADGVYQVTADRIGGERLVAEAVAISCDPAHPSVSVDVVCTNGDGLISVTATNQSQSAVAYSYLVAGLPARERAVPAGASVTVNFSGRPDGRYRVDVSTSEGLVFRNPFQVSCDPPVLDGVTIAVDCVADNGRIRVTVANETSASETYFVTVEGLAPRSITIAPQFVGTVAVTGRADKFYVVTVAAGSVEAVFSTQVVGVACDGDPQPRPPIPDARPTPRPPRPAVVDRVAVVGDFGGGFNSNELQVAELIDDLDPDFITTVGDNVYSADNEDPWAVLDRKVGQYYHEWIYPYYGQYGEGSPTGENRFFPALGNHDYGDPGTQLLFCEQQPCTGAWVDFFTLPNNERYYVVEADVIDFFIINDYYLEPDGHTPNSIQARWLRDELASSDATWKVIINHFPPYANGRGGSPSARWPFQEWGADALLSGHVHSYERQQRNGFTSIINGLGGIALNPVLTPTDWTRTQYNAQYGATLIEASATQMTMELVTTDEDIVDWSVEYVPGAGETLQSIAAEFKVPASTIRDLNPDVDFDANLSGVKMTIAPS